MNAAGLAALIAALFWALLACAGAFALLRLGRLLGESSKLTADLRERGDALMQRAQAALDGAQAAVDRANGQLDRTEPVTASMDELGAGLTELTGQLTSLARAGRVLTAGPAGRLGAVLYGVRHAVALRRGTGGGSGRPRGAGARAVPGAGSRPFRGVPGRNPRGIGAARPELTAREGQR